jgi:IclR family KDG regulon transcriptional repressor
MEAPNSNTHRKVIASVQRALDILNLFDSNQPELGISEISRLSNLHIGTVAGLVYTLKLNSYLTQNSANRKYRLGLKLADRASVLFEQFDLRKVAMLYLEKLREWCGESINLAIRDGSDVIYIERLFGKHALGIRSELGKHAPAHSTALGKAILAYQTPEEILRFINGCNFIPMTRNTITSSDKFLAELDLTRQRGFAIDEEENEIGGRCLAAPIFTQAGLAVGAVSISVPVQRLPTEFIPEFGMMVRSTAFNISRELGFQPKEP